MSYQTIEVKPISGSIGAEIFGVDLSKDVNQQTYAEIHRAFLENLVIFFRDQDLSIDRQAAFVRRMGPLIEDPFVKSPEDRPELLVVAKDKHERLAFGEGWHSDSTFMEKPPMASCLYAKEVPVNGGDTMFANQYLAYDSLSAGLKKQLDGLKAVHTPEGYAQVIAKGLYTSDRTMQLRNDGVMTEALKTAVEHPVVRTHPETGRKALYVNRAYVKHFAGWTEEESKPLLEFLYAHAVRPEFTCRFRWRQGSMALWDNRSSQHHPINDYHGQRRVMHRIVAQGDRPV